MEGNRAGTGGISGKPACRLHPGIVPHGTPEGERGAEVGREDGCALKNGLPGPD